MAWVLDFGIAKPLGLFGESSTVNLTVAGSFVGTPQYMAPEQALEKTSDLRSDIYSLGVILYEMLTGEVPFKSDSPVSLLMKHVNEKPIAIRDFKPPLMVPERASDVVMKTLEKNPEDRYSSVAALMEAFDRAVREADPVEKPPVAIAMPIKKSANPFPTLPALGAIVLMAAVYLVYPRVSSPGPEPITQQVASHEKLADTLKANVASPFVALTQPAPAEPAVPPIAPEAAVVAPVAPIEISVSPTELVVPEPTTAIPAEGGVTDSPQDTPAVVALESAEQVTIAALEVPPAPIEPVATSEVTTAPAVVPVEEVKDVDDVADELVTLQDVPAIVTTAPEIQGTAAISGDAVQPTAVVFDEERKKKLNKAQLQSEASRLYQEGKKLVDEKKFDQAQAKFREAIFYRDNFLTAHLSLATLLLRSGKLEEGKSEIDSALAIDAGYPPAHYAKAAYYGLSGDVENTIVNLKKAFNLYPGCRLWLKSDPDFEAVRSDPRFQELVDGKK